MVNKKIQQTYQVSDFEIVYVATFLTIWVHFTFPSNNPFWTFKTHGRINRNVSVERNLYFQFVWNLFTRIKGFAIPDNKSSMLHLSTRGKILKKREKIGKTNLNSISWSYDRWKVWFLRWKDIKMMLYARKLHLYNSGAHTITTYVFRR